MTKRVAIIGGDAGGMGAGTQARRTDPSLEIVAFEKSEWTSYSACGIPYVVGGEVAQLEDLIVRTPQQHRDTSRIDVRTRHEVMAIDLDTRRLEVRDHAHERTIQVPFDDLVIGTGAVPIRPQLPGIDRPEVRGVQTLEDANHLLRQAVEGGCRNVAVVGGGYVGLEMAEAFVRRGLRVTLVDGRDHVMNTLDGDMATIVEDAMRKLGIDVRLGTRVTGFADRHVETDDGTIPADLVVLGIGVAPNATMAAEAGIDLGTTKAIRVDRRQRTSVEGVWAAGDCAESFHIVSQRPVHIALGTVANRQARVAGINIGGGYATFPGVAGTAVTKICGTEIGRTGLTEREATEAGFEFVTATIDSTTVAGYLGDAPPARGASTECDSGGGIKVRVKMVAEKGSGRVLGAQLVGGQGAAKRVDVVATALYAGLTAQDVLDLDLAYAPPFGPLWDPVAVAARKVLSELG